MAAQMSLEQLQLEKDKLFLARKENEAQRELLERDKLMLAEQEFRHKQLMYMNQLQLERELAHVAMNADKNKSENDSKMREEITALNKTVTELVAEVRQLKETLAKFMNANNLESAGHSKNNESASSTLTAYSLAKELKRSQYKNTDESLASILKRPWKENTGSAAVALPSTASAPQPITSYEQLKTYKRGENTGSAAVGLPQTATAAQLVTNAAAF